MELIQRRRGLIGSKTEALLPDEYKQVNYIESPGLCWFNVPIVYTSTDIISVDIVYQILATPNDQWVAGANDLYGKQFEFGYFSGHWMSGNTVLIEYLQGSGAMAKVHAYSVASEALRNANSTWRVFGRTGFGISITNCPPCRIWSHSWIKNGEKMIDLIPCYRKSDGEVGMYDLATGMFYTNQGTGEGFTYG